MPRGWMPDVQAIPSVAKGGYGVAEETMQPDSVFIHTIEGWQHVMASPSWTNNSYHFTIRLDGHIIQHVSIYTPAWHAGLDHRIDPMTGKPRDPKPIWWKRYRDNINPNAHSVGISGEGSSILGTLPRAWVEPQVESAIRILKWIKSETGIIYVPDETLVRHSYIAPHRRKDPGDLWPEARVLAAVETPVQSVDKIRLEFVGNPTIDWTDKIDEREIKQRIRIVVDD